MYMECELLSSLQGAEMPEIGAMLTDFTGREFGRVASTNLVKRFHRERAKVNSETGEKVASPFRHRIYQTQCQNSTQLSNHIEQQLQWGAPGSWHWNGSVPLTEPFQCQEPGAPHYSCCSI